MSTVADYIDRTIDVSAFQGIKERGEVLAFPSLTDAEGKGNVVTGIAKLGQRFLLELLTEAGSMRYKPTRGSTFLIELNQGYIRTQLDLFAAFNRALIDIKRTLQSEEADTDPDDERYGSSEILGIEFMPGWASVSVALRSLDANAKIILPISLTV